MLRIWLIGTGNMATEYYQVLSSLKCDIVVIGRSEKSSKEFEKKLNTTVVSGGIRKFLTTNPQIADKVINTVNFIELAKTTIELLEYGIKDILVEKPAGLNKGELAKVKIAQDDNKANIFVAYNRRFYSSTNKALDIIKKDGGVKSFNFEFTEWAHTIDPLPNPLEEKEKWFLGNSTHVVDLAFFIGGKPEKMSSFTSGSLKWHKNSCVFSGSGISKNGALFSYQANWDAPGRWGVEILTSNYRLYLRPMEKLQIQNKGSVAIDFVDIDDSLDIKYKPGLFKQTEAFCYNSNDKQLCSFDEHFDSIDTYYQIANYK